MPAIACEQALWGALAAGREKEGELAITMLIGRNDISNDVLAGIFQCLLTFTLVYAFLWLVEIWQLSQRATWEMEGEFKFPRQSCKLSFLFPPCRQSAPESLLTGYVSHGYVVVQLWFNFIFLCFGILLMYDNGLKQWKIRFIPRIKLNHNMYNSQKYWLCAWNPNEWRW